jgi:hypothetical protein
LFKSNVIKKVGTMSDIELEQAHRASVAGTISRPVHSRESEVRECGPTRRSESKTKPGLGTPTGLGQAILQAKLSVGPAGDVYEREADAVADRVVRSLATSTPASARPYTDSSDAPRVQRSAVVADPVGAGGSSGAPRVNRGRAALSMPVRALAPAGRIRRSTAIANIGHEGGQLDRTTEAAISSSRGGGRQMEPDARHKMETAFGADFGGIRIHEGSKASELNDRIQAKAFTVGSDIYFRDGAPNTSSTEGQHLLAHELTHTIQQGGRVQRALGDDFDPGTRPRSGGAPPVDGFNSGTRPRSGGAPPVDGFNSGTRPRSGAAAPAAAPVAAAPAAEIAVDDLVTRIESLDPKNQKVVALENVLELAKSKAGRDLLDKIVNACSKSDTEWIKKLFAKEFTLELTGSWTSILGSPEALQKTYLAFHLLPSGTVRESVNVLGRMKRTEGISSGGGNYGISMTKLMPLWADMSWVMEGEGLAKTGAGGSKFLKKGSEYSERMKSQNAWTMTVLHEVGHNVDTKRHIMGQHMAKPAFGAWEAFGTGWMHVAESISNTVTRNLVVTYTPEEQVDMDDYKNKKTNNARPTQNALKNAKKRAEEEKYGVTPKQFSEVIAELADMKQEKITVAGAVKTLGLGLENPALERAVVSKLNALPAVQMVLKGKKMGAWEAPDAEKERLTQDTNGRFFHYAYPGEDYDKPTSHDRGWVSFDVKSCKDALSNYQYRTPGEYFAELYCHYYMGTMDGHPLKEWFARNIDIDADLHPDEFLTTPAAPPVLDDDLA